LDDGRPAREIDRIGATFRISETVPESLPGSPSGQENPGQKNEHAMQAQLSLPWAIFLPTIFLPNHSRPITPRALNGIPQSMSALSPIPEELRAFPMNDTDHGAATEEFPLQVRSTSPLPCIELFASGPQFELSRGSVLRHSAFANLESCVVHSFFGRVAVIRLCIRQMRPRFQRCTITG
jgi:hypothetical protein